jgi:hypothetical protein
VALQRFFLTRRVGNLVVFSLFAISAARMKSSEIQIVSCAALTALIIWLAYRDRDGLKLLVSSFACAAVAGASLLSMGDALSSSQRMVLAWDPWNGLRESARILHFPLENGLQHLLYLGIYVLGYLGMRVVAIRYISATTTRDGNYLFLFLGIFIVSGCLLSEFIYLGNPERSYNNAVWFRVQSIIAATFFVIYFIYEQKTRRRQLLWSLLFVAISIPSTLNFLWLEGRGTQVRVSGSQMEVVEYMRKNLHHNAVIMEPPDQERPSLAANLAGRQSVISLFFSFLPSQAPISELRERLVDVTRFFKNELSTEERLRLYDKYGITHVLAPSAKAEALKGFPELHLLFGSSEATIFSRTR